MYRHLGALRESCPQGSLNHFYGSFILGFLWPVILLCLVLRLSSKFVLRLSQGPPMCVHVSLSQDGFQQRGVWVGWHHWLWGDASSVLTTKGLFRGRVVRKVSLTLRIRDMWSLIWVGLSFSSSSSWSICPQGQTLATQPGVQLSPATFSPSSLSWIIPDPFPPSWPKFHQAPGHKSL